MNTNTAFTSITVPTKFVDVNGSQFAYRRFGKPGGRPLVFIQHLLGTLDNWDPAVLDGFAKDREVISFDNAGIARSGGNTPNTIAAMAKDAAAFVTALGLKKIDLLGFSTGGMIAQQFTLDYPDLVNRLILLGTGPRGGEGMETYTPEVWAMFAKQYEFADELNLDTLFAPSATSQAAGQAFLERIRSRTEDRDTVANEQVATGQLAAIAGWGVKHQNSYDYFKNIKQPTLVLTGHTDIILPAINSFILQQHLPDATLVVYPDSNHGPHDQYPELFVKNVTTFLEGVE